MNIASSALPDETIDDMRTSEKWFVVVDPELKDLRGHYFDYDRIIAHAAAARGFTPLVLAHKLLDRSVLDLQEITPTFSRGLWQERPRLAAWNRTLSRLEANHQFYRELCRGLAGRSLGRESVVFGQMVHGLQLLGWAWFARRFAGVDAPNIVLMLRFQSDWYADSVAQRGFRLLERLAGNGRIRLVTDSSRLAADHAPLTSLPIDIVPIPHIRINLAPSAPQPPAETGTRPLRFVSLGNARDEKGIIEIMQAIELLQSRTLAADFEFILHTYAPYPDDLVAKIDAFAGKQLPNVRTISRALTSNEYTNLLYEADVVLLPYWREIYRARTSGILIEAIAAGKPVIVTEDTWMSDQLALYGAGEICANRDAPGLAETICKIGRSYPAYLEQARRTREKCAAEHNSSRLIERLVPPKLSNHPEVRRRRAIVFLGWPLDSHIRNSGAGLRFNCLLKFLSSQFRTVHVFEPRRSDMQAFANVAFDVADQSPGRIGRALWKFISMLVRARDISRASEVDLLLLQCHFDPLFSPTYRKRVRELIRAGDIVFIEYTFAALPIIRAARRNGCISIVTDYDVVAQQIKKGWIRKAVLLLEKAAMKRATHAVSVATTDQATFSRMKVPTVLIPNSIDIDRLKPPPEAASRRLLRKKLNADFSVDQIALFVGSSHPPNTRAVLRIREYAQRLEALGRKVNFVVAGSCHDPERAGRFFALGTVDEAALAALYGVASLVIIPLEAGTGASLKTIEAMALAKPVLGTPVAFRGLSVTNEIECIVEHSLDAFPERVCALLSNPATLAEIGKRAAVFARSYDYRKTFKTYLKLAGLSPANLP